MNDERFTWLIDTFLKYFTDWKISINNFDTNAKANMFLSWQTYEGLKITAGWPLFSGTYVICTE